jgi:hypothetical protein
MPTAILKNVYFLTLNDPNDIKGGTTLIAASGYNFLVGVSGSINFGSNSSFNGFGNVIAGGQDHYVGNTWSAILGGRGNQALGAYSTVIGGEINCAQSNWSTIGGGSCNCSVGEYATIAGGRVNCMNGISSFIGGGWGNKITSHYSTIVGGFFNQAGFVSSVLGGWNNFAGAQLDPFGNSPACFVSIVGGCNNRITTGVYNVIVHGRDNLIYGPKNSPDYGSMLITCLNTVINGEQNIINGICNNTIINGNLNIISGACMSIISNGRDNSIIKSDYSSILAGNRVSISSGHSGSAVLSDSQDRTHTSSGPHSLTLDFASGVYFAQTGIFGQTNFSTTPQVNGTTVALSDNVVDLQNNQNIGGVKNFTSIPQYNGVDLAVGGGFVAPPATPNSPGTLNDLAVDLSYFYVCIATNKWIRTALSSW